MTTWLLVAAVPAAVALLVLCLRDPLRTALPLFAASIPFGGLLEVTDSPFGSVSSVLGMVLGVALLAQLVRTRHSARSLPGAISIWLLFLAAAAVTLLWSVDRPTTVSGLVVLGSLVALYVLVAVSPVDADVLRRTENGLLVGGVAATGYGLFQLVVLGGFPGDVPGSGITPDGRFGNDLLGPGIEAVTLLLPLAIATHRASTAARRPSRAGYALIAVLVFTGILMTGARAGSLAAVLVLLVLAWAGPRRARKRLLAAVAVGVVAGSWVWISHPADIATRTFDSAASSSGRTDIWRVGAAACSDFCAFGAGWGTYPQVYARTQASVPGARVLVGDQGSYQPHNLWLLAAIEMGVVGVVLLTWGLLLGIMEAARLPRSLRGPPLSAVVGLTFAVFFLSSMEFKFFWMVLIMVAMSRNVAETEAAAPRRPAGAHRAGSYPSATTSQ